MGRGQLHPRLRGDPRVVVRERTNARHLRQGDLGEAIDLVVIDASFIGLGKLLPAAIEILRAGGEIVAMVKPQFEADRRDLKKGVVRDPEARERAIAKVEAEARALGLEVLGRREVRAAFAEAVNRSRQRYRQVERELRIGDVFRVRGLRSRRPSEWEDMLDVTSEAREAAKEAARAYMSAFVLPAANPAHMPARRTCSPSSVTSTTSPSSTNTSSSSCVWQCRIDDSLPGINVVRLTPIFVSPTASPSARFSRGSTRDRNGSGWNECVRGGRSSGSIAGGLAIRPIYHDVASASR